MIHGPVILAKMFDGKFGVMITLNVISKNTLLAD